MAPPLAGAAAPDTEPETEPAPPLHDQRDAKRPRGVGGAGARARRPLAPGPGARIVSLGVQAAVMAAALALFVLFAAAAAVLLLHLVVAARAFRRHHHRSRYRVPSLDPSPAAPLRAGLSPAELRRLPSFDFASPLDVDGDGDGGASQAHLCAVCLEAARAGERWRALPACGHAFHAACVDRWLAKSPACPVCRVAVAVSVSCSAVQLMAARHDTMARLRPSASALRGLQGLVPNR
ncbi:hypothetical protein ACP4OV_009446 [Aristida adscensionis]